MFKPPYPRERSRVSDVLSTDILVDSRPDPDPLNWTLSTVTGLPAGTTEVMKDIVTPGFTSIKKAGGIVNNSMEYKRDTLKYANCTYDTVGTHPVGAPYYQIILRSGAIGRHIVPTNSIGLPQDLSLGAHAIDLVNLERLIFLAATGARNKITKDSVQGLVSLIEFPKTIDLIRRSVGTILQIRKAVVSGNPSIAIRAIGGKSPKGLTKTEFLKRSLKDRWLEFRYGWTPLVMEVQGAVKLLDPGRAVIPRATARRVLSEQKSAITLDYRDGGASGLLTYTTKQTQKVSVRAYALYTADLSYQRSRDFGLNQYPQAIWELIPFSFVVDWFVQVGDWLSALTPKLGVKLLSEGYVLEKVSKFERTCAWTKQIDGGGFSYDVSGSFLGSKDTHDFFYRQRVPNLDILYTLPPVNVKLNVKRAIDAIALLSRSR